MNAEKEAGHFQNWRSCLGGEVCASSKMPGRKLAKRLVLFEVTHGADDSLLTTVAL